MCREIGVSTHSILEGRTAMSNIYYVYSYTNPLTNEIFYIGKGKNGRLYNHLEETKENTENYFKWCIIESLRRKNIQPLIEKIIENLTEDEAYKLETEFIIKYGRKGIDENGILTNRCLDRYPPRWETYPMEEQIAIRKKCGDATRDIPKPLTQRNKMSISRLKHFEEHPESKIHLSEIASRRMNLPENIEKERQKLLQNPMNDGIPEHNPRALFWKFIDPEGNEFIVKGRFKHFCRDNNLSASTFRKSIDTGIWPTYGKNKGWILIRLPVD